MSFLNQLEQFSPSSPQEMQDREVILEYARQFPHTVLTRSNKIAHITSSGFIVNKDCSKVLLVHHNIRGVWGWTGGHADGNPNLLEVALQEAEEETGAVCTPLSPHIASLDILPVFGHFKNGVYVNVHLHLSVAYLLCCDENANLQIKPDENSGVKWFDVSYITSKNFTEEDTALYQKLIAKAKELCL